ncbi:MAG: hypothetical protein FWC18_03485 [Cystobacterineae bacterium]|nr:hypothetical protein [Cystobacterineae bacterium]MCL2258874.1 hypothetical protein [Cystobacterineae bacterium]
MEKFAARQRYSLQVVSREEAGCVPLYMGRVWTWNKQLLFVAKEAGVWVERIPRTQSFFLNDIQMRHGAWMKPGDEIRLGAIRLLLLGEAEPPLPALRMIPFVEMEERLEEAFLAPGADTFPMLFLVSLPHLHMPARMSFQKRLMKEVLSWQLPAFWARLAWNVLACALPAAPMEYGRERVQRLVEVAGKQARIAWACFPEDGMSAAALLDSAWVKLGKVDARIEPVLENAGMVRLAGMVGELSKAPGPLLVLGGEGQGRAGLLSTWFGGAPYAEYQAMALLDKAPQSAAFRAPQSAAFRAPQSAAFLVRSFDKLPPERQQFLLGLAKEAKLRLGATARGPFEGAKHFPWVFHMPPLAQRREDIWPLAQAVVASVKQRTNRPRLSLGEVVRGRLEAYGFPKGVRELKNWVVQAAVASLRDEIGKEALPAAWTVDDTPGAYEEQMAAAEYRILLESLARARWNVSAAAKRLNLPRRTLVFRMAKLGLKRPDN